jgi:hypothetical protein
MEDPVWHRVDRELALRRDRHTLPGTWSDVARALDTTEQRVNNWKRRGVPSAQYAALAAVLGWTVDHLIGVADIPQDGKTGNRQTATAEAQQVAALYANLSPTERRRFLHLLAAAKDDAPVLGDDWGELWTSRSTEQLIDETVMTKRRSAGKKRRLG